LSIYECIRLFIDHTRLAS